LSYIIFACGLIVASFIDLKERIIPDEISVGGIILGFLLSILIPRIHGSGSGAVSFYRSLVGVLIAMGLVNFTAAIFNFFYFGILNKGPIEGETESMGGGDVKLMGLIGAFLGWRQAVLAFFTAPFLGVVFWLIACLFKRKSHLIPYGPSLSLGALIALLWGQEILKLLF
jgi:leader peptidase (prepilin peptidase)/N-methyltransferase